MLPGATGGPSEVGGATGAQCAHGQRPAAGDGLLVPLVADDQHAALAPPAKGQIAAEQGLGGPARTLKSERHPRLFAIGDADHIGQARALGEGANDLRAGLEVLGDPGLVATHRGPAADPDRDVGDHAQGPLGADDQLAQRRSGGGVGRRHRAHLRRRRDQAHRADEVVEAAVATRGLPRRPGRGEAADRRVLEGLGEVAEDEAGPVQLGFGLGAAEAGAQGRGQRSGVDADLAQADQIETYQSPVGAPLGGDAADDAGATAEGDDRHPLRRADLEHPAHLLRVGRADDGVGRRIEAAAAQSRQVRVTAPGRVPEAVLGAAVDGLGPDRVEQALGQPLRRRQREVLDLRRPRRRGQLADPLAQRRERGRVELGFDLGIPPAPPLRVPARRRPGGREIAAHDSGSPARARSIPSRACSRIAPWPRRIIGEPRRDIPRSACSELIPTSVPSLPGLITISNLERRR